MKTLKQLLHENYYISNEEYLLLEELVTSKQLDKFLTFEKIDKKDAVEIIISDEYNNGKDLFIHSYEYAEETCMFFNKANTYKIKYKDKLVGVFGFTFLKDYYISRNKFVDEYYDSHMNHLETLFCCFYRYFKDLEKVNERIMLSNSHKQRNYAHYQYLFKDFFSDDDYDWHDAFYKFCLKTVYISFLQISNEAKEKYEISPMALILIFYKKLEQFFVENDIKLMIAHGINQQTTNKYVKIGKFENPVDLFEYFYQNSDEYNQCIQVSKGGRRRYTFDEYYEDHSDFFTQFVIKRID